MAKEDQFLERVFAVAFTDSVHSLQHQEAPFPVVQYFKKVSITYMYMYYTWLKDFHVLLLGTSKTRRANYI